MYLKNNNVNVLLKYYQTHIDPSPRIGSKFEQLPRELDRVDRWLRDVTHTGDVYCYQFAAISVVQPARGLNCCACLTVSASPDIEVFQRR